MFRKMYDSKHVHTMPVTSSQISMLFSFSENWKKNPGNNFLTNFYVKYRIKSELGQMFKRSGRSFKMFQWPKSNKGES